MVHLITEISSSFNGGWIEAVSSLGSMAYGAGHYDLVGQYAQVGVLGYVLCELPFCFLWGFSMKNIVLLMGFGDDVAEYAQDYVWLAVAMNILGGIHGELTRAALRTTEDNDLLFRVLTNDLPFLSQKL